MSKNIVFFEGPVVLRLAWRVVTEEKTHFPAIEANTVPIGDVLRVPNEFQYNDEVINEQRTITVILTHTRHLHLCSFCTTVFCLHGKSECSTDADATLEVLWSVEIDIFAFDGTRFEVCKLGIDVAACFLILVASRSSAVHLPDKARSAVCIDFCSPCID